MPQIAVVGSEGVGKTVFVTVLTKRIRNSSDQLLFRPSTRTTMDFVEACWERLRGSDWPNPTAQSTLKELRWSFRYCAAASAEMQLFDIAGEDFRMFFGQDDGPTTRQLEPHQKALMNYFESSDIVLLLVNLADFKGESVREKRNEKQWALLAALDFFRRSKPARSICVVFTQKDRFGHDLKDEAAILQTMQCHLEVVFDAHFVNREIPVFAVSAVASTQIHVEGGVPLPMPAAEFESEGFSSLVNWLSAEAKRNEARKRTMVAMYTEIKSQLGKQFNKWIKRWSKCG